MWGGGDFWCTFWPISNAKFLEYALTQNVDEEIDNQMGEGSTF